ncbi:MAG: transcription antitermination factor NusB [Paracoccus sp. (in: a-proteobacteria)]|uniref:transcription antitermination factor NusB n=1 Tax=Paracoccus sp. TaxID=267 RepID=UPI0026DF8394|nr:transcription antitermination factor NusB [Paracoccus sp. (in: a-proteobacteria)]MDO5621373.1 transcription antitermination factor NusB [Paracoccus sp. (in: a-proteobacteria)]
MSDATQSERPSRRELSSAARFYAVQALFQMEAASQSADKVGGEFLSWRIGIETEDGAMPDADKNLFTGILDNVVTWQARIDQLTDRALVAKWPIGRIDPVLRAVFRAAGAELVAAKAPPRVVISEYLRVAEAFFTDGRETRFVNAVLDHMAHEVRPEGF